jgi:DNA-binding transcriptional MerR regulator
MEILQQCESRHAGIETLHRRLPPAQPGRMLKPYEQVGILPPAHRVSGQRRYHVTVLHRLTVIQRARQTGFTRGEIKELFFGFRTGTPPSVRWQKLRKRKIVELDAMLEHIQTMRDLLEQQGKCRCSALEECGKKMFEKDCGNKA